MWISSENLMDFTGTGGMFLKHVFLVFSNWNLKLLEPGKFNFFILEIEHVQ